MLAIREIQQSLKRAKNAIYMYNITSDIISHHQVCQNMQAAKVQEPVITRQIPKSQFNVMASDLFAFENGNFLQIVDSFLSF
jgi:hypothetical protein